MPNKNNNINNQLVASPLFPVTITIVSLYQITFIHAIHTMIIPPTLILHEIHRRWETPTKHLPRRGTLNSTQLFTFPRLDIKSTIEFSIHDLDIEECAGRGVFRSVWKAQQKQQASSSVLKRWRRSCHRRGCKRNWRRCNDTTKQCNSKQWYHTTAILCVMHSNYSQLRDHTCRAMLIWELKLLCSFHCDCLVEVEFEGAFMDNDEGSSGD